MKYRLTLQLHSVFFRMKSYIYFYMLKAICVSFSVHRLLMSCPSFYWNPTDLKELCILIKLALSYCFKYLSVCHLSFDIEIYFIIQKYFFILLNLLIFSENFHTYRKVERMQQMCASLQRYTMWQEASKMVLNDSHLQVLMPFANIFTKSLFPNLWIHFSV